MVKTKEKAAGTDPAAEHNASLTSKGKKGRPGGTRELGGAGGLRFPELNSSRALEATMGISPLFMSKA
jgi:hypothetical protein